MFRWMVFREDFNNRKIVEYNIFDHYNFLGDCKQFARKHKENKEAFLEEVRTSLMYYFWSKSEHEVIITGWPPKTSGIEFNDRKVDIYAQVMMNWHVFSEYIWSLRQELARRPKKKGAYDAQQAD